MAADRTATPVGDITNRTGKRPDPDAVEQFWRSIRLAAPARRALVAANISSIDDFASVTEDFVRTLHGMGPKTMPLLQAAMAAAGVTFRS